MKNLYVIALLTTVFLLLTSSYPIVTKSNESVIFGRLILDSKTSIKSEKLEFYLSVDAKHITKVKVNKDGFFAASIAQGYHNVEYIKYRQGGNYQKRFYYECLTVTIPKAGKIYYAGDIHVRWTPTDKDKVKNNNNAVAFGVGFGLVGSIAYSVATSSGNDESTLKKVCPEITIEKSQDTVDEFMKIYPDDNREILHQYMDLY